MRSKDLDSGDEVVERATRSEEDDTEKIISNKKQKTQHSTLAQADIVGDIVLGTERASHSEEDDTERIAPNT